MQARGQTQNGLARRAPIGDWWRNDAAGAELRPVSAVRQASLQLSEHRLPPLTLAIVGCGPAGLAAALFLHRQGHGVTLFERFDVPRPLGSGLMIQPTGRRVLAELGLADDLIKASARIYRLHGVAHDGRVALDVRYDALRDADAYGLGVHRATLFGLLFDAVRGAGVAVETGRTLIEAPLLAGGKRRLVFADGTGSGPFDLVVDASGVRSPLAGAIPEPLVYGALWTSLDLTGAEFPADVLSQRYRRASAMAGVMPMDGGRAAFFWSLKRGAFQAWRAAPLDAWKDDVRALWPQTEPLLAQIPSHDALTFATYHHRMHRPAAEPGLIRIGDAWRAASPQLGQGANMALLDALALGLAMERAKDVTEALGRAVALRRLQTEIYQALSFVFTPFYQGDSRALPWLRDRLLPVLAATTPVRRLLAAMVAGSLGTPL